MQTHPRWSSWQRPRGSYHQERQRICLVRSISSRDDLSTHLLQLHSSYNELSTPSSGPRRQYASPGRMPSIATRTDAFIPARPESRTSWHHILSFNPSSKDYLRNLQKGSHVYVEANFELREPDPSADPTTPQGQRQIFLRHGTCSVSCLPHAYLMPL